MEISQTDLGWVAGIMDGEGFISILRGKNPDRLYLSIGVGNTDARIVKKLHFLLGGSIDSTRQYHPKYKTIWMWRLNGKEACKILTVIMPFLVSKREEAYLALEFGTTLRGYHRGNPVPEEVKKERTILYNMIKVFKKNGPFKSSFKQVLMEPDSRPAIEGEVKEIYAINQEGS